MSSWPEAPWVLRDYYPDSDQTEDEWLAGWRLKGVEPVGPPGELLLNDRLVHRYRMHALGAVWPPP